MSDHPSEHRLLEQRLYPHRSLTQRGFFWFMLGVGTVSFLTSIPFVIVGAWPVAGFMGLDVLLLYWAFRVNFRSARAYEDVLVTPIELLVAKVSPRGGRQEWRFNPAWVRVEREEIEDFGVHRLAIVSRGRSVEIATCLGPDAKGLFAERLTRALSEARRGPRFTCPD